MMYQEVRKYTETRFKTQWDALTNGVVYTFLNKPLSQPKEWLRVSVVFSGGQQDSIGGAVPQKTITGTIIVQIFTEKNSGGGRSKQLADIIGPIFEMRQAVQDGVQIDFRAAYLTSPPEQPDYFMENLIVPFEATK